MATRECVTDCFAWLEGLGQSELSPAYRSKDLAATIRGWSEEFKRVDDDDFQRAFQDVARVTTRKIKVSDILAKLDANGVKVERFGGNKPTPQSGISAKLVQWCKFTAENAANPRSMVFVVKTINGVRAGYWSSKDNLKNLKGISFNEHIFLEAA